jgi:hypothetical protein
MRLASWTGNLNSRLVKSAANPRRHTRLAELEILEDRVVPTVYTVTNVLDNGGAGSLRWAINQTNIDPTPVSNIIFNIGSGVQTITLTSVLPALSHSVIIDGTSQPGYSGTPIIQ